MDVQKRKEKEDKKVISKEILFMYVVIFES